MHKTSTTREDNKDRIVLGTVGEFKTYGLRLSSINDETPDSLYVTLPVENAINIANSIVDTWGLTPSQHAAVMKGNDHQRITDILHIEMYLDILVSREDKFNWILGANKDFSDMRVVDYIIENGTEKVVEYLALFADGGGW